MKAHKKKRSGWAVATKYFKKACELALAELLAAAIMGGIYMGIHASQGLKNGKAGEINRECDKIAVTFYIDKNGGKEVFEEIQQKMAAWNACNGRK